MNRRKLLLLELLSATRPIQAIASELAVFDWDSEIELVTIDRSHIKAILMGYLAGQRTAAEVRAWAEAIEAREDIAISDELHNELKRAIFQLANPEIGRSLSPLLAQKIMAELRF